MTRRDRGLMRWAGVVAVASFASAAGPAVARAEVVTLESTALQVELTTEPYGYRVIERATREVLVSHSRTTFTAAENRPDAGAPDAGDVDAGDGGAGDGGPGAAPAARTLSVLRATNVVRKDSALEADLLLEGTADTARLRLTFTSPEVLEVELSFERQQTRRIREEFNDQQERVFGIWGYPFEGHLDNRGNDREYLGLGQLTGSLYTSGRAPFYLTSRRYGVYARSQARGRFTVAMEGKTSFAFDEPRLRYQVIYGPSYNEVLARYTALAGGPYMPPLWAFGSTWWSDDFHRDLRQAPNAQANVLDLATQLQQRRIPATALMIDRPFGTGTNGWGNMDWAPSFPDPPAMAAGLKARGLELVLWIANRAWNGLYTEGNAQSFLFPGSISLGPAADLRNPAAYAWMKGKLAPFVELGAKGYKIDRGEQGEHPDTVQNENVTLFARLAQESLTARHGAEGFVFARNVADTGRKHAAVWNGDSSANFLGLTYSIAAGLRSGMIVMPMWGSDTGGYLRGQGGPSEELFARWFGFSAYSPMMEVLIGDGHTPWYDYSPALVDIARKHAATHHDLIPYTRSFMFAATRTGRPVMRTVLFEYPDDPNAAMLANLADQYLYGSELMVAPVVTPGAVGRGVYLPVGRWLDYHGRLRVEAGGRTAGIDAPLDTIPVFVREGAIVPRGDIVRGNNNWTDSWAPSLRIEVFPGESGTNRFDYYDGVAVKRLTTMTEGGRVTITLEDPGLPGTLEVQLARIGRVTSNGMVLEAGSGFRFDEAKRLLTVPFRGATTLVIESAVSVFAGVEAPPPTDAGSSGKDAAADAPAVTDPAKSDEGGCDCAVGGSRSQSALWWVLLLLAIGLRFRLRAGS